MTPPILMKRYVKMSEERHLDVRKTGGALEHPRRNEGKAIGLMLRRLKRARPWEERLGRQFRNRT